MRCTVETRCGASIWVSDLRVEKGLHTGIKVRSCVKL